MRMSLPETLVLLVLGFVSGLLIFGWRYAEMDLGARITMVFSGLLALGTLAMGYYSWRLWQANQTLQKTQEAFQEWEQRRVEGKENPQLVILGHVWLSVTELYKNATITGRIVTCSFLISNPGAVMATILGLEITYPEHSGKNETWTWK